MDSDDFDSEDEKQAAIAAANRRRQDSPEFFRGHLVMFSTPKHHSFHGQIEHVWSASGEVDVNVWALEHVEAPKCAGMKVKLAELTMWDLLVDGHWRGPVNMATLHTEQTWPFITPGDRVVTLDGKHGIVKSIDPKVECGRHPWDVA